MSLTMLPSDMLFLERGWLSSNSLLLLGDGDTTLIDSGYHAHADQTIALTQHALAGQPLKRLFNTHLHSDHCGGNAAIQAHWPEVETFIPPGSSDAVSRWDELKLTYRPTGQICPRFVFNGLLEPGVPFQIGHREWQVLASPGHDPDAVLLFQADTGVLLSADALWEHGFGVVFPEISGEPGFQDVARTLDLIEQLRPKIVIPGHGAMFTDVDSALSRARERLKVFMSDPLKHASHAAKVLIKFHLMAIQRSPLSLLLDWSEQCEYFKTLHRVHYSEIPFRSWMLDLVESLLRGGALSRDGDWVTNH